MWYPDNQLRKKLNLCMPLQANKNILCKNQIRIQNMYQQFKYEQLHVSAQTTRDNTVETLTTNNI